MGTKAHLSPRRQVEGACLSPDLVAMQKGSERRRRMFDPSVRGPKAHVCPHSRGECTIRATP
jgi:hypothetical protein